MVALILVLIAVPLQLLGYTGTCTQGGDDEALAGAVFSAPFLLVASLLMVRHLHQAVRRVPHLLAGFAAAGSIALTSAIWLSVLRFGNGCLWKMEEPASAGFYATTFDARNALMLCSYLIFPALVILLARFDKALASLAGMHRQTN